MAAAEILVCRLSQSMFTHLTLIPVCLVKAASAAFGGGSEASATVMVAPRVLLEPCVEPPDPQPATSTIAMVAAAAATPRAYLRLMTISCASSLPPDPTVLVVCGIGPDVCTQCAVGQEFRRPATADSTEARSRFRSSV